MKRSSSPLVPLLFAAVLLAVACGGSSGPVTEDQVKNMAESALTGLNDDDHSAWTADFGITMRAAVPRDVFVTVREGVMSGYGSFRSIEDVDSEPATTEGHTRWLITANFERGQLRLVYVIPNDGKQIKGVFLEEVT